MIENSQGGDPRGAAGYGPSLAAVVAAHGPLPVSSVTALAAGLAQALSAAHAAGILHRDINPASVLLTADGPRLPGPGQPAPARPLDFTSPELAALLLAGPASDIYSLGAVLLYAATGNLMSHAAWHPEQLPGELRPVIERCMAADPARRPTAAQLLTELTAARPGAVNHVAGRPPVTQTAGPARSGSWPAQGGTPAPAVTPAPAPSGHPAATPSSASETVIRGARKRPSRAAGSKPPAAGLMSRTARLLSRVAGPVRRPAVRIGIAALVVAVAVAGTVYVIHPWGYPVLRPTGLTADQRSATSISLGWSNPASGPLPDKYVILRDGAVAATVPGNQDHFKDAGLAPATTYNFQIIAYRGSTRSQPSLDLRAATQTPELSDAVFNSSFKVTEGLKSDTSTVTWDTAGDTWHDHWTFSSNCALGPCATRLSGAIDGRAFTAVLKADGNGNYTGTVPISNYFQCSDSATGYVDSTLEISISAPAARDSGTQWRATKLSGNVTWVVSTDPSGNCGGGWLFINVAG